MNSAPNAKNPVTIDEIYAFKVGGMWRHFKKEHFSFWMICAYLFFEFVRPQGLFPVIDVLPWTQLFLVGALGGAIMDPTVKWTSSPANKWITLFLIWILISIQTATYPEISKKHFMDFFGWFVIYFLVINIINTKERFYIFLCIYILAAGKIAVGTSKSWIMRGFSFTGWGLQGPRGFFQNSGELTILMLMLFPLAFYIYRESKTAAGIWERRAMLIFAIAPILTILGASSRGSQIALAGQLIIIFRRSLIRPKSLLWVSILIFALLDLLPEEQKQRFESTGEDRTSMQRILYWTHGWEMMKAYPITGVGYFNFASYYEDHFPQDMFYAHAELPHNIFIQIGTDAGFPAVFFFSFINLFCLWECFKISRSHRSTPWSGVASGLGFGVFGFLIAGQFVTVSYYPFLWIHLAFIAALKHVLSKPAINQVAPPMKAPGRS